MGPLLDAFGREKKIRLSYFCPHTQRGSSRRVQTETNTPKYTYGTSGHVGASTVDKDSTAGTNDTGSFPQTRCGMGINPG